MITTGWSGMNEGLYECPQGVDGTLNNTLIKYTDQNDTYGWCGGAVCVAISETQQVIESVIYNEQCYAASNKYNVCNPTHENSYVRQHQSFCVFSRAGMQIVNHYIKWSEVYFG